MQGSTLSRKLDKQRFLNEYWQQKPLLIRQAFPDLKLPFSPEELAGLCCDTDAPARIIIEHGKTPWEVIHAPLKEAHFLNMPETNWTVLVNDIERYYPELLSLIDNFRFIPDWRIDDLMVSYAADGGSVGPHVDQYDVFLIQGAGRRHWMLDPAADTGKYLPDIELNILSEFTPRQQWTLEAGDMLYLPPNLAHHGIAKGNECITFSIGFRAPSQQELLESWLDFMMEQNRLEKRYGDAGRAPQQHPGKLEPQDITAIKDHMLQALKNDEDSFTEWLGRFLTAPKNTEQENYVLDDHLGPEVAFFRAPASRLSWVQQNSNLRLFINGEGSDWPVSCKDGIEYICSTHEYIADALEIELQDEVFQDLFKMLIEKEIIYFSSRCKD